MAAKGSFGSYSSVPTTTGMGQGSAQVFTPQAGRLDTTAIQRGAQAIGQGISDAAAEKDAEAAARKKKMMDVSAAAYKQETDFPKTEALKQEAIDKFMEDSVNGTDLAQSEKELMKSLGYIDVINKQGKEGFKNAQSQSGEYKDALYWDEENMKYENPTYQYEFLGDSSTDDVEDIQLWAADTMQKMSPKVNENIMYNPKFTEGDMNKALLDEIDTSLKNRGQQKLNRVYNDKTGELIVQETLTGITEDDYNSALEAVQNRPDFLASYMTTRAIEEGNAPSMLSDDNAKDIYRNDYNAFVQEAGERYRPSKLETKTLKVPTDGGGKDKDKEFNVTKTVLGKGDAERLAALKADEYDQMFSDLGSNLDSEEDQKAETARLKDRFVVGLQAAIEKNANLTSIQITKKGEELKPITIGSSKGTLQEVYINPEGKGFLIINEEKTVSSRTKDGTDGETISEKVIEPKVIELNDRLIGKIEAMYGVDLLEKKYIASNGYAYTKQQLIDANYTEEYIKSLKTQ